MNSTWHPRGTPTWPGWKTAKPGQRVRNNRTGREGSVVRVSVGTAGNSYVRIAWDAHGKIPASNGVVVAPAFDLTPID